MVIDSDAYYEVKVHAVASATGRPKLEGVTHQWINVAVRQQLQAGRTGYWGATDAFEPEADVASALKSWRRS